MSASIHTEVTVEGMTCGHCVGSVTKEIKEIAGVSEVVVDLASGKVSIDSEVPLDFDAIVAAVDEAGYSLVNS